MNFLGTQPRITHVPPTRCSSATSTLAPDMAAMRAARIAAMSGAKVLVAEEHRVGGTCVIRGCVPKKFMVYASEYSKHFETARGYGWDLGATRFDWPRFLMEKDK